MLWCCVCEVGRDEETVCRRAPPHMCRRTCFRFRARWSLRGRAGWVEATLDVQDGTKTTGRLKMARANEPLSPPWVEDHRRPVYVRRHPETCRGIVAPRTTPRPSHAGRGRGNAITLCMCPPWGTATYRKATGCGVSSRSPFWRICSFSKPSAQSHRLRGIPVPAPRPFPRQKSREAANKTSSTSTDEATSYRTTGT